MIVVKKFFRQSLKDPILRTPIEILIPSNDPQKSKRHIAPTKQKTFEKNPSSKRAYERI